MLAGGGAAVACARAVGTFDRVPWNGAVDFLPWYLGARALVAGLDPTDPEVLRGVFEQSELRMRPGGFFSYYPRTASLWAVPVHTIPLATLVPVLRWALLGCIVGSAAISALAGAAGTPRTRASVGIAVGAAISVACLLRVTGGVLRTGQPGPVVLLFTALALAAIAGREDGGEPGTGRASGARAGVILGLGMATKFLPVVVVAVAIAYRRWRIVGVASGVFLGLTALTALLMGPAGPAGSALPSLDLRWLSAFLNPPLHPHWRASPAWVLGLHGARLWLAFPTVALVALAARRGAGFGAAAALAVAWAGVVLAGTQHTHEAIQIIAPLGWILGWPCYSGAPRWAWIGGAGAVATFAAGGALAPGAMSSLDLLPGAGAVWLGCGVRLLWEARRR